MKIKHVILLLIAIASCRYAKAGNVDSATAVLAANNWYRASSGGSFAVTGVTKVMFNGRPSRYIVSYSNGGFVMNPVLAYSTQQAFSSDNMSPELSWLLSIYDLTSDSLITYNVPADSTYASNWQNLLNQNYTNQRTGSGTNTTSSVPTQYLQTTWGQGYPYNMFVGPSGCTNTYFGTCNGNGGGSQSYSNKCPSGCVATAMGQIMRYWNYPHGIDYNYAVNDVTPHTIFDWCNMSTAPGSYPDNLVHDMAVGTLIANLGSALGMSYCDGGSCESSITDIWDSKEINIFNKWGYSSVVYHGRWSNFWKFLHGGVKFPDFLMNELKMGRPIYFSGSGPQGGHAFVLDGADPNATNFFHFNFGWDGCYQNTFYYIDGINVGGDSFNNSQGVITQIQGPVGVYGSAYDCTSSEDITYSLPAMAGTIYNSGNYTVNSGTSLILRAYNEVHLGNGFTSQTGANFAAVIIPCPNCPPPGGARMEAVTASTENGPPAFTPVTTMPVQTKLGTNLTLGIFPNPTSGIVYLNLSAQKAGDLLVNISDLNGNRLMHTGFHANDGANSFKVDLSALNSGAYFINITDENGVTIKNDKLILMGQ